MRYPPDFTYPEAKSGMARYAAECIAALAPGRRTVVQAGGCVGLWPLALSQYFERVYTFEPAPTNVACLRQNIAESPTIRAFAGALSNQCGSAGLTRPKVGAGLWRLEGDGDVEVVTLDSRRLDGPVDALVLDVEGGEVAALEGADETITRGRPLIWLECIHHTAAIEAWLAAHDYGRTTRGIGRDYYSLHASLA